MDADMIALVKKTWDLRLLFPVSNTGNTKKESNIRTLRA